MLLLHDDRMSLPTAAKLAAAGQSCSSSCAAADASLPSSSCWTSPHAPPSHVKSGDKGRAQAASAMLRVLSSCQAADAFTGDASAILQLLHLTQYKVGSTSQPPWLEWCLLQVLPPQEAAMHGPQEAAVHGRNCSFWWLNGCQAGIAKLTGWWPLPRCRCTLTKQLVYRHLYSFQWLICCSSWHCKA